MESVGAQGALDPVVIGDREEAVVLEPSRHVDQRARDGGDRYPLQCGAIGSVEPSAPVDGHERRPHPALLGDPELDLRRTNAVELPEGGSRVV